MESTLWLLGGECHPIPESHIPDDTHLTRGDFSYMLHEPSTLAAHMISRIIPLLVRFSAVATLVATAAGCGDFSPAP